MHIYIYISLYKYIEVSLCWNYVRIYTRIVYAGHTCRLL